MAHNVTVTAQDGFGNTTTGYRGTVHFTSSDGPAVLPADYTFVAGDNGTHTFTNGVTLKTAGTQSITATDTATGTITGTQSGIVVNPASATALTVSGFTTPTAAGAAHNVTVTAQDAFGNIATGYRGTVHFTSSDGQAVLPANYTFVAGDNGTHTFSVTLKTAGTQSITATDTATGTITGTQSGIVVNPAGAATLTVSGFPNPTTAGVAHNVTVTAQDAFGNVTPGYLGTVHFTSSDGAAVLPANYTFVAGDAGTHTFSATLKTAGTQSITATDTATGTITGTQSGISVLSSTATTLTVSGFPSPTTAGTAHNVTVTAQDAFGNTATGYIGTVHFTSTDGAAVLPANYTFVAGDAGTHTFSATLKTVGTRSITATDTATGTITGTQSGIVVHAAIALVQQDSITPAANTNRVTPTLAGGVTAGNALVLVIADQSSNSAIVSSVSGGGVTWASATTTGSTANGDAEIWYGLNSSGTGGSTAITVNLNHSTNVQIADVSEWSGIATSAAFDQSNNANNATASISAGAVTPSVGGELIISDAYLLRGNTTQPTPTNGFTPLTQLPGPPNSRGYAAYLVDGTTSSISTTWTEPGGAGSWSAAIATFEP